jgi:predicted unusual protein kinase regulating ubiquinone biosynthesis (AarF/ABC1/UbiB family)
MMSVRPDVLPESALEELAALQDSVKPFDTATAVQQIESELGGPLGAFFSEISEEPVAAASLAQVYKAKLSSTGEYVAVKIQRPRVLETVSKDLYVLRRAAEVFQSLTERFAPQQRTDYVALLNEWAVGFYTELDFLNEGANQMKLKRQLEKEGVAGLYIPDVYMKLCTRRVLVSEWMDGMKLSDAPPDVVREQIPIAQEAFLVQLLQTGFFHGDPHPGNILLLSDEVAKEKKAQIALIDFGLIAAVAPEDRETMVSSIIHLANRDYARLVDDFINLNVLPDDCDRSLVIPLMDKALTPYVKGGGAQKYEAEVRKLYGMDGTLNNNVGGFQAMTQDALTVLNDVPFAIPPYFALLGRAIVTLEGIALTGDPDYGIIKEAYPFVSRKLLSEDSPAMQKALRQVLYGADGGDTSVGALQGTRLVVLLNSALGVVAQNTDAVIDLDTLPEDGISIRNSLKYVVSPKAEALRALLTPEIVTAADLLLRQSFRKSFELLAARIEQNNPVSAIARIPGLRELVPKTSFVDVPLPFLLPPADAASASLTNSRPIFASWRELNEALAPRLNQEEELYALSLADAVEQVLGKDAGAVAAGDIVADPSAAARLLLSVLSPQGGNMAVDELRKTAGFKGISDGVLAGLGLHDTPLKSAIPILENISPLINSALQASGVAGGQGAESTTGDIDSEEVLSAIAELSDEEAATLQDFVDTVVSGIQIKLVDRLSTLSS